MRDVRVPDRGHINLTLPSLRVKHQDSSYSMARAGLRERKRKQTTPPRDTEISGEQGPKPKRLKPQPTTQQRPGSVQLPAKGQAADSEKRCYFLELPRELRDEIYKHVIVADDSITLKQSNFLTKAGLIGVNNQITNELLDIIFLYAPVITTTVRNNNFAHIVTFLNRLSEAQFERLHRQGPALKNPKPPRTIKIIMLYTATKTSTKSQLNRWLDRFDDPNRRGAEIDFQYECAPGSYENGGYKQRPGQRSTAGPRSNEEALKILRLRRRYHGW